MADHIAINILNAAINDNKAKKSNIVCDHSSYHKFILVSWGKIVHEEVQKGWIVNTNVIKKIKDEK